MSNENPHDPNRSQSPQSSQAAEHARAAAEQAKAAALDAVGVFKKLMLNPVGGIGDAHAGLAGSTALGVGLVFGLVAAILIALSSQLLVGAVMGAMMGFPGGGSFQFGPFLKSILAQMVMIAAAAGAFFMLAPVFGGRGNINSGFFVSGAAFLPFGIAMFLSTILIKIMANRLGMILVMLLILFGVSFLILVLNAGLRKIADLNEERAALATPAVLGTAALISGVIAWLLS